MVAAYQCLVRSATDEVNVSKKSINQITPLMKYMKTASHKSSGFTLVEVLIAVVILSIGLLGLAGLQTLALRQNTSSQLRSNAVELINELTDRMRANITSVNANPTPYNAPVGTPPAGPGFDCMTNLGATNSGTGCNSAEMAAYDLFAWQTAVQQVLPGGLGTLLCTDSGDPGFLLAPPVNSDGNPCTVGSAFIISVTWNDGNLVGGVPAPTTFSVTFQP